MNLKIFCDGGSRGNPGPAAIGFVVQDENEELIFEHGEEIGRATNNTAEYQAVVYALHWLAGFCWQRSLFKVDFFLDSKLVVNQVNGNYKVKKIHLKKLLKQLKRLEKKISIKPNYHYICREKNHLADSLLNQALDQA